MTEPALRTPEEFEDWLATVPSRVQELREWFRKDTGVELDFAPSSLDTVEEWIIEFYVEPEGLIEDPIRRLQFGAYIGEVFRRELDSKWTVNLTNRRDAFYGLPVIHTASTPVPPHSLATAALNRKTGRFIRGVLESYLTDQ